MNQRKGFEENKEDELIEARVSDAFAAASRYTTKFVGFLDPHEAVIAKRFCEKCSKTDAFYGTSFEFFGGFDASERVFLGVFPPYSEHTESDFPITAVEIEWRFATLTHRDFLGALLGLGIVKSKIGDIVVGDSKATVFLEKTVASFVLQNLAKVGSAGVHCEAVSGEETKREDHFKEIKTTVASSRLDCVVSALTGLSRTKAAELISSGLVSVNFEICSSTTFSVSENATVSIRGHGRFAVDKPGPCTRKGRLTFKAKKYL